MFTVIRSFESSIARQSTFENGKNTSLRSSKHRTKTESPKLYLDRQSLNKANDQMRVASFLHCVCKMYTNVYYCGVCVCCCCVRPIGGAKYLKWISIYRTNRRNVHRATTSFSWFLVRSERVYTSTETSTHLQTFYYYNHS